MIYRFLPLALGMSLIAASGCAFLDRSRPEVDLVDLQFSNATLMETEFVAQVRISNLSADLLKISGAVHKIYLNDIKIGSAISDQELAIPRLSTATQTALLRISNWRMLSKLQGLLESDQLDYRIESTLHLPGLLGLTGYNATTEGTFFSARKIDGSRRFFTEALPDDRQNLEPTQGAR